MSSKTLEKQVEEEQQDHERRQNEETTPPKRVDDVPDGKEKPLEPDPEKGQLFEVPRAKVVLDDSDPTVLKIAFAGGLELDRAKPAEVAFYNRLKAGKVANLEIGIFVAGPKKVHRRDSEGNVDAIVETKTLLVTDVEIA